MVNDWFSNLASRTIDPVADDNILLPIISPRFAPTRDDQALADMLFVAQVDSANAPPFAQRAEAHPASIPLAQPQPRGTRGELSLSPADQPPTLMPSHVFTNQPTPPHAIPSLADQGLTEIEREHDPLLSTRSSRLPRPHQNEGTDRDESHGTVPPSQLNRMTRRDEATYADAPYDTLPTSKPTRLPHEDNPSVSSLLLRQEVRETLRPVTSSPGTSASDRDSVRQTELRPMPLIPSPRPTVPLANRAAATESAPTVTISIGRIDIRAQTPASTPAASTRSTQRHQAMGLDDYLQQRRGGRER